MTLEALLQMSVSAGLSALLLAALRRPLIRQLGGRGMALLWMPVLLRLLVPGRIALLPGQATHLAGWAADFTTAGLMPGATPDIAASRGLTGIVGNGTATSATHFLPLPLVIWLVGAVLVAILFAAQSLNWRVRLADARPCPERALAAWRVAQPIRRRVRVLESRRIVSPMTCGVIRPRVYLPTGLDPTVKPYALLHEGMHILRLDALTKGLMLLALCAHWFNPAVWLMALLLPRDLELATDAALLRRLGAPHKGRYAHTLVRMASHEGAAFSSGLARHPIEERIIAMLKPNVRSAGVLALLLVALMGATLFAGAQEAEEAAYLVRTTVLEPDVAQSTGTDPAPDPTPHVFLHAFPMEAEAIAQQFTRRGHPILLPTAATLPQGTKPSEPGSALVYLDDTLPDGVEIPQRPADETSEEDGVLTECWAMPTDVMTQHFSGATLHYQSAAGAEGSTATGHITLSIQLTALEDAYPSRSMLSWIGRLENGLVLVAEQTENPERIVAIAVPEEAYLAYQRGARGRETTVYSAIGQFANLDTLTAFLRALAAA